MKYANLFVVALCMLYPSNIEAKQSLNLYLQQEQMQQKDYSSCSDFSTTMYVLCMRNCMSKDYRKVIVETCFPLCAKQSNNMYIECMLDE